MVASWGSFLISHKISQKKGRFLVTLIDLSILVTLIDLSIQTLVVWWIHALLIIQGVAVQSGLLNVFMFHIFATPVCTFFIYENKLLSPFLLLMIRSDYVLTLFFEVD